MRFQASLLRRTVLMLLCVLPTLALGQTPYDVGTRGPYDREGDKFYTPKLIEIYRVAPYLHDGRAATLREVITKFNPGDRHGATSNLTEQEIDDLVAYLKSL